jgi:hypothetical protein
VRCGGTDLLWLFVKLIDFTAIQNKRSLAIWHFIQPILPHHVLFVRIVIFPTDVIDAIPFYIGGIANLELFQRHLTATSSTFVVMYFFW